MSTLPLWRTCANAMRGLPIGGKAPMARSRPSWHDGTVPPHSTVPGRHVQFAHYSSYDGQYTIRADPGAYVPGHAFVPRRPASGVIVAPGSPPPMSPRRLTSALVLVPSCFL